MNLEYMLKDETYKYIYGSLVEDKAYDQNEFKKQYCGKNDWVVAQLLLKSNEDMQICVNEDTTFYPKGTIEEVRVEVNVDGMSNENIQVHLVGLIQDDDSCYKSDLLLNQKNIIVEAGKEQAIWIEIFIDKHIPKGIYKPMISLYNKHLFEDEVLIHEIEYEFEVLDISLDDPRDYQFHLDLWQHNSNIARQYNVDLWSDEHFDIIENYIKSLANLGQKVISVIVSEMPWSGQDTMHNKIDDSNLFEYNMARIVYSKEGQWVYDFSAMERYINICLKYGIDKEIEVFGLSNIWLFEDVGFGRIIEDVKDGIRLRYYDENQHLFRYIRKKEELAGYVKALEQFFIEKGLIHKVRILADEPAKLDEFINKISVFNEMAKGFQYKVAINNIDLMGENIPHVVDYCPSLGCTCDKYEELHDLKEKVDGVITYYVCCGPEYPNTFIKSPAIEARIIPWIAWVLDLDGFLRWNYTAWPKDPLNKIAIKYPYWPAGDTNFVYPGKDGIPILTIRYMNLKRGIRDYEIINRYVSTFDAKEEVNHMLKDVFYWERLSDINYKKPQEIYSFDYEAYNNIINHMLKKLS
ncbi:DUF4091 domain-containing protein [Vallitalea maricola]|uniref:DUF4091 domain-containing protein n=1 Tax=Vallitalea maricola TaxID=3074433 RepID=A0ACB5UNN2_9FIRM|nr:DUF4091 domain-containing protein [Vallitalea sp. AN17-2]